jgi:hypothetical protein
MNPKEFYKEIESKNFPMLKRGDLIFTNNHHSFFAKAIRFFGRLSGRQPLCNHVEMYVGSGKAFSADYVMKLHQIKRYFSGKHDVYILSRTDLYKDDRDALIAEAMLWEWKPYDVKGIILQALDVITGKKLSEKYNDEKLAYCSELVQRLYYDALCIKLHSDKCGAVTPDEIFHFISKKDNIWTTKLWVMKIEKTWICGVNGGIK